MSCNGLCSRRSTDIACADEENFHFNLKCNKTVIDERSEGSLKIDDFSKEILLSALIDDNCA